MPVTPKATIMPLNASPLDLFAWTSKAAFEKYLFRNRELHQLFRNHLTQKYPDSLRLLDFFTDLHRLVRTNFTKKPEKGMSRAKRVYNTHIDPQGPSCIKNISKESLSRAKHLVEKSMFGPTMFACVAKDVLFELIELFSDWQVELIKHPEVSKLRNNMETRRMLWTQEDAFERVLFDDNECYAAFKSVLDDGLDGDDLAVRALQFCKDVVEFKTMDFFTETPAIRTMAKNIYDEYLNVSNRKNIDEDDIIISVILPEERAMVKRHIDDTMRPVPQKLFDFAFDLVKDALSDDFLFFQKQTEKALKKQQKKMEKEAKKKAKEKK